MKIERRHTTAGQSPYAGIEFRLTTSEIRNPDGSVVFRLENVEVPNNWSQVASDVLAQKYFRKAGVALLFTDVVMPGMSGRVLAEEVAKTRPDVKVLYTSGYADDGIVHQGKLDPGVLLLPKPYRRNQLAEMIRLALGKPPGN